MVSRRVIDGRRGVSLVVRRLLSLLSPFQAEER